MSPLNTVLDDSIGCALWFAARGVGRLRTTSGNSNLKQDSEANVEDETYTSRAKVQQLLAVTQKCQSECMFIPKQRSSKIAKFRKIESIVAFRALQPGIVLVAIPAEIKKLKSKKMNPNTVLFLCNYCCTSRRTNFCEKEDYQIVISQIIPATRL